MLKGVSRIEPTVGVNSKVLSNSELGGVAGPIAQLILKMPHATGSEQQGPGALKGSLSPDGVAHVGTKRPREEIAWPDPVLALLCFLYLLHGALFILTIPPRPRPPRHPQGFSSFFFSLL